MTLSELRAKDVVNIETGKRLGKVIDLDFCERDGCITAIVVPGEQKFSQLIRGEKCGVVIPWQRICRIGDDIILVQLEPCDTPDA